MREKLSTHVYLAEAYPKASINIGAGSLALYLGSEPNFQPYTVWFTEVLEGLDGPELAIDPENRWWIYHLEVIHRLVELSQGDYIVSIPDIVENLDILSALRGPQNFCIDLLDHAEEVKLRNNEVQRAFYQAYQAFYEIVKEPLDGCSFTAFRIWGPGKTAKA